MDTLNTLPTQLARWLFSGDPASPLLLLLAGALAMLAVAAVLALYRHLLAQRRRLDRLEGDLRIFTEASTRVADSLNQVLNAADSEARAPGSSRRYLLQEARQALAGGDDLLSVGQRLGLCRDELLLLRGLQQRRGSQAATRPGRRIDQAA